MATITTLDALNDWVKVQAKHHTKLDLSCLFVNLFVYPATLGLCSIPMEDTSALKTAKMPDEWANAVAELPAVSQPGMKILVKCIKTLGYVSVDAAQRFVAHELDSRKSTENKLTIGEGVEKLLARAEAESPGTLQQIIQSGSNSLDALKEVSAALLSVAALGKEKVLWAGKASQALADVSKELREIAN